MRALVRRGTQLTRSFDRERVRYVLFGGQAVNLHGILRFTEDIDLFVEPTAENVEHLRRALRSLWDDPSIDEIRAEDLAGEYAVVRYGTPDDFAIDLVARRRGELSGCRQAIPRSCGA